MKTNPIPIALDEASLREQANAMSLKARAMMAQSMLSIVDPATRHSPREATAATRALNEMSRIMILEAYLDLKRKSGQGPVPSCRDALEEAERPDGSLVRDQQPDGAGQPSQESQPSS